ncbi:hypothetical protein ACXYMO_03480 [Arenibacterium sp. CAU 1754]
MQSRLSPLPAYLVLVTALGFAASPMLVPGFGGFEPTQFPVPQVDPPVQPAGYAFAIWAPIYAWLVLSAAFGVWSRPRAADWQDMRPPLALAQGLGILWLPVAEISPLGAFVLIWAMLASALVALKRAPVLDRWLARAPVGLFAGWLMAASSVSVGLMLGGYAGVDGRVAAIIGLALAFGGSAIVLSLVSRIPEFALAVTWALAAVVVANWGQAPLVAYTAATCGLLMIMFAVRSALR